MKLRAYLEKEGHGAATRLAREISGHVNDVVQWSMEKKEVPVRRAVAVERATGGAVTRQDLRPNDWHEIWPELATPEQGVSA